MNQLGSFKGTVNKSKFENPIIDFPFPIRLQANNNLNDYSLKCAFEAPQSCKGCTEMIRIFHLFVKGSNHLDACYLDTEPLRFSNDKPLL